LHDLKQRLLVGGGTVALLIVIILLAARPLFSPLIALVVAAVVAIAMWEYLQMARLKALMAILCSIAYVFSVFMSSQNLVWAGLPLLIFVCSLFIFFVSHFDSVDHALSDVAIKCFGFVYITVSMSLILNIFSSFEGIWWVVYLLVVTKGADSAAFFVGRSLGKRKLAAKLSPAKTVEGALGGIAVAMLISLGLSGILYSLSWSEALWLGALVGAVGQVGDLAESLIKRDVGVKDSNAIPGLGGVFDMIDSLLFTAPVVYRFLML